MTPAAAPEKKQTAISLSTVYKLLLILGFIVGAAMWFNNVSATAQSADSLAKDDATKLEQKANRSEVEQHFQHIESQLDSINTYLRDHH